MIDLSSRFSYLICLHVPVFVLSFLCPSQKPGYLEMSVVVVAFHEPVIAIATNLCGHAVVDLAVLYIDLVSAVNEILAQNACS